MKISSPIRVGTPPCDARVGLLKLDDGVLMHYKYDLVESLDPDSLRPRFCIYSEDHGYTWKEKYYPKEHLGADIRSPISGEYLRYLSAPDGGYMIRAEGGLEGKWKYTRFSDKPTDMQPFLFIRNGKRVLFPFHTMEPPSLSLQHSSYEDNRCCGVYYSDDDGLTWKCSNMLHTPDHHAGGVHLGRRWNHGAFESSVVELKDGRLWMLIRTSQDQHYESFSTDGGETWSPPMPSRFYGTLTMPVHKRLDDGRILVVWNNSTPLPELANATGDWEDVFTNRDVLHAAISDDDGETWHGFRELVLNENRYDSDYGDMEGTDKSVHQNQFVQTDEGLVLVSCGQHPKHRRLMLFDPAWLYEKSRRDDFSDGLADWSTHMYLRGVRGHCGYNRQHGAELIEHPNRSDAKVLHIARRRKPELLCENQGAVWNFPALRAGSFKTRIYLRDGFRGAHVSLMDRWFNPTDLTAAMFAVFGVNIPADRMMTSNLQLQTNKWYELCFTWGACSWLGRNSCTLSVDSSEVCQIPLQTASSCGVSYVHFISTADTTDDAGFLVEYVESFPGEYE